METCQICCGRVSQCQEIQIMRGRYETFRLCPLCVSRLVTCEDCKRLVCLGYVYVVNRADTSGKIYVCTECRRNYVECPRCGKLITPESLVRMGGSYRVCPACAHNTKPCMACRELLSIEDFKAGDLYCVRCRRNGNSYYRGICSADFRPIPVFYGEEPYYGIELEVDEKPDGDEEWNIDECVENLNSLIVSSKGRFFLKDDGSLHNGFEIVSQPHSMVEWENQTWLAAVCKQIIYDGGVSFRNSKCGFHIHRSRKDLSEIVIVKLLTLFIKLQPFFEKVAQRKSNGYCKFSFLGTNENNRLTGKLLYDRLKKQDRAIMDRYMALNITGPATIECRIFRGSLVYKTVLAYLKFFHLLCAFAKKKEITLRIILKSSPVELWGELCKHFEQDSHLIDYLIEKRALLEDCVK